MSAKKKKGLVVYKPKKARTYSDVKVVFEKSEGIPPGELFTFKYEIPPELKYKYKDFKFEFLDFGAKPAEPEPEGPTGPAFWRARTREEDPVVRRDTLVREITRVEDLGASFDLSAFPLPLRVAMYHQPAAGICSYCQRNALHIYMKVLPRGNNELPGVPRGEGGLVELNTCTLVNQAYLDEKGPARSIEQVRGKLKDMVLHEFYEALMFRGERIMDPHHYRLKPEDQPF